jgi:hypothetical protein
MRRVGIALVALAATTGAASADTLQIPRAFWGEYASQASACGHAGDDGRLVITATKLTFGESSATPKELIEQLGGALVVMAEFAGEGERWSSMRAFQLSDGGATLTMLAPAAADGPQSEMRRVRCPAGRG